MNKEELLGKLKLLRRKASEESPSASVFEAIDTLIQVTEFLLIHYQPERSKREDSVSHTIPEYGANSSLNFDEWQRRCGALNTQGTE